MTPQEMQELDVKIFNGRKYTPKKTGKDVRYVSTTNPRIHLSRALWEAMYQEKLKPNELIHHKNGNMLDDSLKNLEKLTIGEHTRQHNKKRVYKTKLPKICSKTSCFNLARALGLCTKHYQRMKKEERGYWL